ncbi:hypothetical protein BN946_scf184569.g44 [Trametes cinnabarina]|uniref:FAD/NAD(P)-binding domain-containing protein n=1 Tax=Pycnoporus cinnabarinus TaxID=5643 RepID=A0A060S8D3_PYCCI|nr:hypothetical protein BN946_scf184569.g44 [Trametes cinnabarina]
MAQVPFKYGDRVRGQEESIRRTVLHSYLQPPPAVALLRCLRRAQEYETPLKMLLDDRKAIISLLLVCLFYVVNKYVKYRETVRLINNWPGFRTLFADRFIFLPFRIRGVTPGPQWTFYTKHGDFAEAGWDVISAVNVLPTPGITYYVADAVVVKEIISSQARFPKMTQLYDLLATFGSNILVTEGEVWKRQRKIAAPAFSERNYRLVWDETIRIVEDMFQNVWGDKDVVEIPHVLDITVGITLLVIGVAGFGRRISWTEDSIAPPGHTMTFKTYLKEMVQDRRSAKVKEKRHDLFSNLLDANEGELDNDAKLTDSELLGNVFIFLVAGYETTAHTLAYAFILLALYQDEQEKFYQNIKSVLLSDQTPESAEDTTFNVTNAAGEKATVPVPRGSYIGICTRALHFNPRYWDDPEAFKPERFLGNYHRDAFLPFSGGARGCVGRGFAETESVAVLSTIISRYRVEVLEEPQFAGETFEQRKTRLLKSQHSLTVYPERAPLVFKLVEEFQRQNESRRNICVVGAGPAGLAAVKIIKDSQQFKDGLWTVTAFEARNDIGGIWLPAPPTGDPPLTPLYDSLTTNLPHPVMAYSSFSFPLSTPLFPPASTVLTYMKDYAAHFDLMPHIRLNAHVVSATRDAATERWTVTTYYSKTNTHETGTFNHIIVANGHYRIPRLPDTPGLSRWLDAKKAFHAVYYRNPSDFGKARTVLVVGAGPSGQDLCTDLLASGRTVVHSVTGATNESMLDGSLKVRGRVAKYLEPTEGRILFDDGSEETGIDCAVLATGYKVSFPFLPADIVRQTLSPPVPPLPRNLYNSTYHVFPLARHIFPFVDENTLPASSIAFIGLPIRVAPLPLLEAQMRAVLHVFAKPESLDPTKEAIDIIARFEILRSHVVAQTSPQVNSSATRPGVTTVETDDHDHPAEHSTQADPVELAIAQAWHRFDGHEQFQYRDALHAFAEYPDRVPAWEVEMYDAKGVLREEWRNLERSGLAKDWVRGVGEAGGEEGIRQWVELMRRLLKRAEERHPERSRL